MFSCKDILKIETETRKLSFLEHLNYRLHIFICNDCQNFVRSMREVTHLAKLVMRGKMKMDESEVKRIEDEVLLKIKSTAR